jgi:hypothetical protein
LSKHYDATLMMMQTIWTFFTRLNVLKSNTGFAAVKGMLLETPCCGLTHYMARMGEGGKISNLAKQQDVSLTLVPIRCSLF